MSVGEDHSEVTHRATSEYLGEDLACLADALECSNAIKVSANKVSLVSKDGGPADQIRHGCAESIEEGKMHVVEARGCYCTSCLPPIAESGADEEAVDEEVRSTEYVPLQDMLRCSHDHSKWQGAVTEQEQSVPAYRSDPVVLDGYPEFARCRPHAGRVIPSMRGHHP